MRSSQSLTKNYTLSPATVDLISADVVTICEKFGMDREALVRHRLSVEECMLFWLDKLGEGAAVTLELSSRFLRPFLRISVSGNAANPYESNSSDFGASEKSILMNIGLVPSYSYSGGNNVLTFGISRRPVNRILVLLLVILSAVLIGVGGRMLLSGELIMNISDNFVAPIEDTFFNILSCIAGPMIFLSVAWGIYGIGDVYTLGKVGKKLMLNFLAIVFTFSIAGSLFYSLLGPALQGASTQESQFGKILRMILDIFPPNIFSPFVDGNTLQIIFIAFIIGLSLIFLGQRTLSVARAIEQINNIINFLMSFISKIVPYFVFVVIVRIIWSDGLGIFKAVAKFAIVFLAAYFIMHTAFILYISRKHKINPLLLIKLCLPSYIIALTTASSAATFESNMHIAQKKLGVSNSFSSFSIPFGMVLFKPSTALYYLLFCFYIASQYSDTVKVSISWVITAVIITAVSSIATPPIPGGAAATYSILFSQLGIPPTALAVALAVDMVFDFVLTSGDMFALLLEIFNVSKKVGMQNDEILRANLTKPKKA